MRFVIMGIWNFFFLVSFLCWLKVGRRKAKKRYRLKWYCHFCFAIAIQQFLVESVEQWHDSSTCRLGKQSKILSAYHDCSVKFYFYFYFFRNCRNRNILIIVFGSRDLLVPSDGSKTSKLQAYHLCFGVYCILHSRFRFGGTSSFKSSIIYWTFIKSHIHLGTFGMRYSSVCQHSWRV